MLRILVDTCVWLDLAKDYQTSRLSLPWRTSSTTLTLD